MARYESSLNGAEMDVALEDMAAHTSERYAKGTANGVEVTSGVGYHDNSKYYKEAAEEAAERAESAISPGVEGAVLWSQAQSLSDSGKAQARSNIGVGNVGTLTYTVVSTW